MRWYETHGYYGNAIECAQRSGDHELTGEIMLGHLEDFLQRGELQTYRTWFERLPPDVIRNSPSYAIAAGHTYTYLGRFDLARSYMYSVGGDLDRPSPDGVTSLRTSLPVLRSVLGSNSVTEMLSEALLIDQSERRTRTRWLISGCRAVRTMSLIAGHPDRGIAALEEALVLIGDGVKLTHARLFCVGYLIVALARVGRWDEASEMWDATEDFQRRHRSQYSIDQAPSLLAEAVIAAHRSDLDGAGDALDQLEPIIELMSFNVAISTDLAIRAAEVAVMCGRNDQVDRLAAITDCGLSKLVDSGEMSARRQSLRQINDQLVALTPAEMRVLKQLATHLTLQQIGRHFGEQQLAVAGGVDDQSRPCADLPRVDRGN